MVLRNIVRHPFRAAASVVGIGFAVAILMVGLVFIDAMERLIATQFWVAERQDVTVIFVEPRSADARHALERLPGVVAVEPQRIVAARIRSGHRERNLAVTGVADTAPATHRRPRWPRSACRPRAWSLSKTLARRARRRRRRPITLEVLEGQRPFATCRVTGVVDDVLGLSVYMDMTRCTP